MDIFKTINENQNLEDKKKIILSKVSILLLIKNIFVLQEKELIPLIKSNIDKISTEFNLAIPSLISINIILSNKEFKTPEDQLKFLISLKTELLKIITIDLYNKCPEETMDVLRYYFKFFAEYDQLYIEGLKFFSLFHDFIKIQKFTSIKAFVFYFAYQTKRYNFPEVQELLGQELLNVNICEPKKYLEFCMYCFYKGLYYIERKNFFMASYLYSVAVSMGLQGNSEDCKILNNFSMQMIRSLCLLKSLSDFDIKGYMFKESRNHYYGNDNEIQNIKYEEIPECLNYIKNEKNELQPFNALIKSNKNFSEKYKLKGLIIEAENSLIFKKIKETLCMYKKIKMSKLAQNCQIDFNDLMKVIKKKVLEGEINIKYDEATDILEVFDLDPGLKEKVQKTKELYKNIIEANKNLFIHLREKKMRELSENKMTKEEMEINMRQSEDYGDEDYPAMDMDME